MAFTIPNEADAANAIQAAPDKVDLDILAAAYDGVGVLSGCAVTAQGTPDMTVAVAAGLVQRQGLVIPVAAGNATITAADGTNPRLDLVVVALAGAKAVRAGTAAAAPVFPTPTAGDVVLAAVYVPAADTTIGATQIVDKRCILRAVVPNPRTMVVLDDDFCGTDTTAPRIGQLGWDSSGTISNPTPVAGHPGVYNVSTGASSGTIARLRLLNPQVFPADSWSFLWIARLNHIDADTLARFGLANSAGTNPPNDGIYFEKLGTDTNWFFVCRATSVETRVDTGVAASTSAWPRLAAWRKDASTISFSVNDGAPVDVTTNITTVVLTPAGQIVNAAAAAKTYDADFFRLLYPSLSR